MANRAFDAVQVSNLLLNGAPSSISRHLTGDPSGVFFTFTSQTSVPAMRLYFHIIDFLFSLWYYANTIQ